MSRPIVAHVYPGNMFGGVESALLGLATGAEGAFEHRFVLFWDGPLAERLEALGREVSRLRPARYSRPASVLRAQLALGRELRRRRPDVLLCHSSWSHALAAPVARLTRLPLVFFQHGPIERPGWLDRLARRGGADLVLVNSQHVARTAPLFPTAKRVVQPLPIVLPEVAPDAGPEARRALEVPDDALLLLIAARLEAWKGHALLLDTLAALPEGLRWRCWIAGAGQTDREKGHEAAMRARVTELGLGDRVRWLGYRNDVPALMEAADLYVQPNLGPEPYGLAFVEALVHGCPVVTTAMGGALEIVDAETGMLRPPDPEALAEAVVSLADPERRASMAAAARRRGRALADPRRRVDELDAHLAALLRGGA
ncbi:MAG: glycosyltransferase [Myxococcota bacterium]